MKLTKIFLIFIISLIISGCGPGAEKVLIKINDQKIEAEIAQTPREKYKGLSKREDLCYNCGMLFLFSEKRKATIVMRDMNFPLDILWIKDQRIVGIDKNAPPEGRNPKTKYQSSQPVDQVLELNGGFCEKHDIKAGDSIKIISN